MGLRTERLKSYKAMSGPSGESRNQSTLDYWSARATENSYTKHPTKPKADGPGRSDKNYIADGQDYIPGVRRSGA